MKPPRFNDEFWSHLRNGGIPFLHADYEIADDISDDMPLIDAELLSRFESHWLDDPETAADPPAFFDCDTPHALCVPNGYEAKYPYPLIIWLHGAGENEHQLTELMPDISDRNYFGLALRGRQTATTGCAGGFCWTQNETELEAFEAELYDTVCQLRRVFHIHSERIFLAGFDEGATTALSVLLRRPEWFAGAIALAGRFPQTPFALKRYRDLHEKRVLLGVGSRDRRMSVMDMVRSGRLLHTAGMDVTTRVYDGGHEVTREMLDSINHWIMDEIHSENLV